MNIADYDHNIKPPKVSQKRLLNYIRRNPGLTTCQLTMLLRRGRTTYYTASSFAARLYKFCQQGKIMRIEMNGALSDGKKRAWRHFHPLVGEKVRKMYPKAYWQFKGESNHPAYQHHKDNCSKDPAKFKIPV